MSSQQRFTFTNSPLIYYTSGMTMTFLTTTDLDDKERLNYAADNIGKGMFTLQQPVGSDVEYIKINTDSVSSICKSKIRFMKQDGIRIPRTMYVIVNPLTQGSYNIVEKFDEIEVYFYKESEDIKFVVRVVKHRLSHWDVSIPVGNWNDNRVDRSRDVIAGPFMTAEEYKFKQGIVGKNIEGFDFGKFIEKLNAFDVSEISYLQKNCRYFVKDINGKEDTLRIMNRGNSDPTIEHKNLEYRFLTTTDINDENRLQYAAENIVWNMFTFNRPCGVNVLFEEIKILDIVQFPFVFKSCNGTIVNVSTDANCFPDNVIYFISNPLQQCTYNLSDKMREIDVFLRVNKEIDDGFDIETKVVKHDLDHWDVSVPLIDWYDNRIYTINRENPKDVYDDKVCMAKLVKDLEYGFEKDYVTRR